MSEKDISLVDSVIEQEGEHLTALSMEIWSHPELKDEEVHAHKVLTSALEKYGFDVERHYHLPTAFRAEYSRGEGPVVAVMCEYDALPEIGHACGHNLIAEAGVAAGLAVKTVMDSDPSIKGKVIVLGCPAEEDGGGKIRLINNGAFRNVDAAIIVHPYLRHKLKPDCLCRGKVVVRYRGREAHASAFPFMGKNALDAAVAAYVNISLLRQQVKSNCRIHGIITKGGTACNVIPALAEMYYFYRAPTARDLKELKERIVACLDSAAQSTGCEVEYDFQDWNTYLNVISNDVLISLFKEYSNKMGVKFIDDDPEELASDQITGGGSTDVGNVSYVVPTIQPLFTIGPQAIHSKEFREQAGTPEAHKATRTAAKALALTALQLLRSPELVKKMKESFQKDVAGFA